MFKLEHSIANGQKNQLGDNLKPKQRVESQMIASFQPDEHKTIIYVIMKSSDIKHDDKC